METPIKTNIAGFNMEKKSKGAIAQKRYRNKIKGINETNVDFMAFASEHAPWLIENKVIKILMKKKPKSTTHLYKQISHSLFRFYSESRPEQELPPLNLNEFLVCTKQLSHKLLTQFTSIHVSLLVGTSNRFYVGGGGGKLPPLSFPM